MGKRTLPALLIAGLVALCLNLAFWWLPNRPVTSPVTAVPEILQSVSFAPFRRGQSPLTQVYPTAAQIEADLALLVGRARGVRTYTSQEGMQVVPEAARRLGLEVTHSAWLGVKKSINDAEVAALIDHANKYPDVIKQVIVGNEVLLRRDLKVEEIARYLRQVRAAVKQPVSYADVWEFWLKNPQLAEDVDFITVHFLPYWEDHPVAAGLTREHIMAVHAQVQAAFPGKPILIGEVGWPSLGRDRQAARPTRTEAVRFLSDFAALAEEKNLTYNIVEAFDQVWKTRMEGTVGGSWGLFDADRVEKFRLGKPVVEKPHWPWLFGASVLAGLLLLLVAGRVPSPAAVVGGQAFGVMLVLCADNGWALHLNSGQWLPSAPHLAAQAVLAVLFMRAIGRQSAHVPALCLDGIHRPDPAPFEIRLAERLQLLFGLAAIYQLFMLCVAGRYRDFPIAEFLVPALGPLLLVWARGWRRVDFGRLFGRDLPRAPEHGRRPEGVLSYLLIAFAVILVLVEKPTNPEAVTFALLALCLAFPYLVAFRARD